MATIAAVRLLKGSRSDFPAFRLSRLSRGETDPDGFTPFELEGEFDRVIKSVREITWFWLLIREREAVCAQWKSFDDDARAATLVAYEKELPEMVGRRFTISAQAGGR